MVKTHARFIIILLLVALAGVSSFAAIRINTASAANGAVVPTLAIEKSRLIDVKSKSTALMLMGSGFPPNQEVRLVISQADGSLSDIGSVTLPDPVKADAFGVWGAQVTVGTGDYLNAAIAKAGGVSTINACDANYNILASSAIGFYNPADDYAKWPPFAKAIVAKPAAKETTPAKPAATTPAATTPAK